MWTKSQKKKNPTKVTFLPPSFPCLLESLGTRYNSRFESLLRLIQDGGRTVWWFGLVLSFWRKWSVYGDIANKRRGEDYKGKYDFSCYRASSWYCGRMVDLHGARFKVGTVHAKGVWHCYGFPFLWHLTWLACKSNAGLLYSCLVHWNGEFKLRGYCCCCMNSSFQHCNSRISNFHLHVCPYSSTRCQTADFWVVISFLLFAFECYFLSIQKVHSPNLSKRKCISEVARICGIIIFHLSKLWKVKFSILCDVVFLWRLQGKFDIDHSQG